MCCSKKSMFAPADYRKYVYAGKLTSLIVSEFSKIHTSSRLELQMYKLLMIVQLNLFHKICFLPICTENLKLKALWEHEAMHLWKTFVRMNESKDVCSTHRAGLKVCTAMRWSICTSFIIITLRIVWSIWLSSSIVLKYIKTEITYKELYPTGQLVIFSNRKKSAILMDLSIIENIDIARVTEHW